MPDRLYDSVLTRVSPNVLHAPKALLVDYVRAAARMACERTLAWVYKHPDLRLTPGVHNYCFEAPTGTEVHAIKNASLNKNRIYSQTLDTIRTIYPGWPEQDKSQRGQPSYITQYHGKEFAVAPVPNDQKKYDLSLIVCLKPTTDSKGMDEAVFNDLEEVIIHGTLQHLLAIPNERWGDNELAAYHAKQFSYLVADKRARTNLTAAGATLSVNNRGFI